MLTFSCILTRDIESKNKLTVTRGEAGGDTGVRGKGRRVFRNIYKGHRDKSKGGWDQGSEVGMAGVGEVVVGKWRQHYLNNKKNHVYIETEQQQQQNPDHPGRH